MNINYPLLIIGALVFGTVVLAMQGIFWATEIFRGQQAEELSRRLGTVGAATPKVELLRENRQRERESLRNRLEDALLQAGNPYDFDTLILRMAALGLGSLFIFSWIADLTEDPKTLPLKVVGVGAVSLIAAALPLLQLRFKTQERMAKVTEQLPEALDLMARSLRAGHGVSESMRMVATEMRQPIAVEFGRVYEEHNLGVEFRECLDHLVARNKSNFDLRIFVSSVLLQRDTGGNLIDILEQIAGTIRQRFVFYGKVRTLTAESRISAVILGMIPFFVSVAIAVIRPEYLIPLIEDPIGQAVSIFGFLWFLLGVYVLYELTKIEV